MSTTQDLQRPVARIAFLILGLIGLSGIVTSWIIGWVGGDDALGAIGAFLLTPLDQLRFFTFMSNVLVTITSLQLALARDWRQTWHVLRIAGIICISITGVVFNLLLAGDPIEGLSVFNNFVVHIATPILAPLLWLLFGPRETTWRRILLAAIIPILWLVVTMARGATTGWYPYTILDVGNLGFSGVAVYIVAILVFYFLLATIMWALDRTLARRALARSRPFALTADWSRADWLRTGEPGATIGGSLPEFEAYAIIEHADVDGEIPPELLASLASHAHSEGGETGVTLAVWAGRTELTGAYSSVLVISHDSPIRARDMRRALSDHRRETVAAIDPQIARAVHDRAGVQLPLDAGGREHLLLTGSLTTLTDPDWRSTAGLGYTGQPGTGATPNYVWPDDQSWVMHCDIDGTATIVGGSESLVGRVLADDALGARPAERTDRIAG